MNTSKKRKENVFRDPQSKRIFQRGLKYLAISLPFLFASPIVVTIGFKALQKDNSYWILIVGCLMVLTTLIIMSQAFRLLLKSLFSK